MTSTSKRTRWLHMAGALFAFALVTVTPSGPVWAEEPLEIEDEETIDPRVLDKLLKEGGSLASQGRHLDAAMRFSDVVENGDPELHDQVKEGRFKLCVSLYNLKLYQSSLTCLEPIVEAGKEHPKYLKTLPYLLFISRAAGAEADVLYKLSQYPPELYPPDLKDELHFLVGQHYFNEGSYSDSLTRFQQVTKKAKTFFAKARYLEGVIHTVQSKLAIDPTRADAERLKLAAKNFKEVLRYKETIEEEDPEVEKLATMTYLALGRLFFSTRQYNIAVRYYDQIKRGTMSWLNALFEVSWVYFQLQNYPRALGNLHTLNSPYFDDQYFPESKVLQSLILFYNCKYPQSLTIIKDFVAEYYPLMKQMQKETSQFRDPNAFYGWLARLSKQGQEENKFSARFKRIFNAALADRKLRRKFQYVGTLNKELTRMTALAKQRPAAKTLLENLKGDVTGYRSLVIGEAGSLAQARLKRVLKELRQHLAGALKVKGETLKAQRGALGSDVRREQLAAAAKKNIVVVDKEHFEWPFSGEYWKDELGSYLYDVKSKCVAPNAANPKTKPAKK